MNSNKTLQKVGLVALALGTGFQAGIGTGIPVAVAAETLTDTTGVAKLGNGNSQITINGIAGETLVGKEFRVYQLFNAVNAVGGESINYTFANDEVAASLKKVVGGRIHKAAVDVTEYEVIDYIQTLNHNVDSFGFATKPNYEGAQASLELEGRYSDFRYFIEELKEDLKTRDQTKLGSETVKINGVKLNGTTESFAITGLEDGYYIVDEINVGNNHNHSAASLCMVNTANPNATIQIKSDYPSIIKKINEDDNNIGWNDIGDYEIGQTVPYKFTSNIPNINGYHEYFYKWHDQMDEELTFNADSVRITISDPTSGKSYVLKNNEFTVKEELTENETFSITVRDIKAILDREFPGGDFSINQDQTQQGNIETQEPVADNNKLERPYGQTVTLEYTATLNDLAALDTGRPGFENDVRLEFSNNPDADGNGETGFTPWDTVVCFTYRIDGLKTTNHDTVDPNHEKVLADAHFRLYSDKECQNEVYVKANTNAGEDGYIVINRDILGGADHTGGSTPKNAVEMISDANGVFKIFGLDQGTYYLKETKAPDGYRELKDPIKIEITPTFSADRNSYMPGDGATEKTLVALDAVASGKQFINGGWLDWGNTGWGTADNTLATNVENGSIGINVVNRIGTKLPITGSSITMILAVTGGAMIVTGLVAKKKKEEKEDNQA